MSGRKRLGRGLDALWEAKTGRRAGEVAFKHKDVVADGVLQQIPVDRRARTLSAKTAL